MGRRRRRRQQQRNKPRAWLVGGKERKLIKVYNRSRGTYWGHCKLKLTINTNQVKSNACYWGEGKPEFPEKSSCCRVEIKQNSPVRPFSRHPELFCLAIVGQVRYEAPIHMPGVKTCRKTCHFPSNLLCQAVPIIFPPQTSATRFMPPQALALSFLPLHNSM